MTALSLLGLLPSGVSVTDGQILWNGKNLAAATERDLAGIRGREIALISQEPMRALDPMFTVGYQLTAAIRRLRKMGKAEARKEALSLLEKVGIVDAERILKTYPHQISGGMAQRVVIAMALYLNPRLVIADEPTTALDLTVQRQVLDTLTRLTKGSGRSMLIVTHDLGVVANYCDRVLVMYRGRIVEQGAVSEVFVRPQDPYTVSLLNSVVQPKAGSAGAVHHTAGPTLPTELSESRSI
ncbi:Oligopeptide transport ATP-binding protein OppD [compost metagenome]